MNNGGSRAIDIERLRRSVLFYRTTKDAALALGITPQAYLRACKREGITPPGKAKK